ncbi:hypothetical protein F5050DRAFT_1754654 [Lentinula boryana]|uniref:Uncharacterized protein n=1 Tax=Lentinula boryana TaxID=40481 RepID=A0ABQ8QF01_9AGAR|nr:hypothetical protein F5050DRAFT_1754654 [Lentinula boryana]
MQRFTETQSHLQLAMTRLTLLSSWTPILSMVQAGKGFYPMGNLSHRLSDRLCSFILNSRFSSLAKSKRRSSRQFV